MKLSPCKHCGGVACLVKGVVDPHQCWSVACQSCGITTAQYSQQDDAIEAWQRKAYGHRNGETARPTAGGRYWFKGTTTSLFDGETVRRLVEVINVGSGALAWNDSTGSFEEIANFDGRWWGPVVAPWAAGG